MCGLSRPTRRRLYADPRSRTRSGKPSDVATAVDDLWRFYNEHATQARQHESLRAAVTGTLAAIAAAVTTLAGVGGLTTADIPSGLVVIVISALGFALSLKHFERNRFHAEVMNQVLEEIERMRSRSSSRSSEPKPMDELWKTAKLVHGNKFMTWEKPPTRQARSPWVKIRLYVLWAGLPLGIGVVGLLVIILGFAGISAGK